MTAETAASAAAFLGLTLLALACGGPRAAGPGRTGPPVRREYHIGTGDVLEVVVWKEPGLTTTAPVRPDGRIAVPLAGDLDAAGRTAAELEGEIAARLAATLTAPIVSVVVKEAHAARVFVLGEVARPGEFPLRGDLTVLQAIALAGGLTEFADHDDIVVLRRASDGRQLRLGFDWGDAMSGRTPFDLAPGDTVVVP